MRWPASDSSRATPRSPPPACSRPTTITSAGTSAEASSDFSAPHFGVRGDLRYFHAFQDLEILGIPIADTKLDFGRLSGGVVFKF